MRKFGIVVVGFISFLGFYANALDLDEVQKTILNSGNLIVNLNPATTGNLTQFEHMNLESCLNEKISFTGAKYMEIRCMISSASEAVAIRILQEDRERESFYRIMIGNSDIGTAIETQP